MKTLLLMRHAKSSWDNPAIDDHERPLNRRGLRDAPRMAAWLVEHGLTPDSITCSTAERAAQTARLVREHCGTTIPLLRTDLLYHAGVNAWLSVIHQLPTDSQRALCIGHNPGLETLFTALTGHATHLPTAAVAVLHLPVGGWQEFDFSKPLPRWMLCRPKDLPDALGDDEAD